MAALISNANKAKVNTMSHLFYSGFLILCITLQCYALTCRSDGGPKEEDLKAMYKACLRKQDGKNSSEVRYPDDNDWRNSRGKFNRRNHWNADRESEEDDDREDRMRNRGSKGKGGGMRRRGKESDEDREDGMRRRESESEEEREDRTRNRGNRSRGKDDRMEGRDRDRDRRGNRDERKNRDKKANGRDDRLGRGESQNPDYTEKHHANGKNDYFGEEVFPEDTYGFPQNHEFGSGIPRYHGLLSTTQPSRRFKRSRRTQNSGQRSQYNPNSRKQPENDDNYSDDDRNSSSSNKDMERKACALHCFMEQLEMTDDDGMPDRYLVTHAITKDVRNEDLKDFLQEAIEECFQMLENEKSDDKCEFSKMLMMCLSEKGKANCDDWKDDLKF